ncbi:hypothetical protein AD24_4578 [Escherichia coli 2-011-08_S4_C3]|uniref:Uncharacterized protein n=1 Tax=virus sp. ct6zJ3 TaxID=2826792 RepID=A0A8S5R9J1_9VIRU|nr:hypothetical protein AC66_4590 [Escherichia coli 2-011-08_S4_C1]KDT12851.1 hypothetical protein AD24_4578 [Escherichia coli 2-011-08_S4_C3]DAE27644.1 MAG TPA: hypothetical protein [virus sp. ct6zJ3]
MLISCVRFALRSLGAPGFCCDSVPVCRWLSLSHPGIPHCDVPPLSQSNLFYTLLTTVFKCDLLHVGM